MGWTKVRWDGMGEGGTAREVMRVREKVGTREGAREEVEWVQAGVGRVRAGGGGT